MPFGYNSSWHEFTCPLCKKKLTFRMTDADARRYAKRKIEEHFDNHSENDPQQVLYGDKKQLYQEVKDRMKIPQSVLESGATKSGLQFIKAAQIGAQLGQTISFTIAGDVEVSGTDNPLYSVPVKSDFKGGLQGQYSLNKTALKILARQLGDETTAWIGARYTSFIGPARNPRTNEQTLGFTILADSVKSAKTK